jgi:hypothetical protein
LYQELRAALALWKEKPSHETFEASSDVAAQWDTWCEANLPSLLAAARERDALLIELEARRLCKDAGLDPDELTHHFNGENWEPYGDRWVRYIPEAHTALAMNREQSEGETPINGEQK